MHNMQGSAGLIMVSGTTSNVPDGLIHSVRQREEEINIVGGELFDILRSGGSVVINPGQFARYEAIFDARLPGPERVRTLLKLLRYRQMSVGLPAGQVRPKK